MTPETERIPVKRRTLHYPVTPCTTSVLESRPRLISNPGLIADLSGIPMESKLHLSRGTKL